MSWDTGDYNQMKKIQKDLNEIKVELKKHNEQMQDLVNAIWHLSTVLED